MYTGTGHVGLPGVRDILQRTCLSSSAAKCSTVKKKDRTENQKQTGQNKKLIFFKLLMLFTFIHMF